MEYKDIEIRLEKKGIKATANRITVYRALASAHVPVTLSMLEEALVTVDKSSIFRVLSLFLEHDVVHAFEDGRGVLHYELCGNEGHCDLSDSHLHFYCESCQKSYCLDDVHLPEISLPQGFTSHSISFVIKGICPHCQARQ
ncbi:MAG: transcriptional repressor [Muribaculaceae bacterium]|nr:transcriptional repressor [Muribaculaceae bacterium]